MTRRITTANTRRLGSGRNTKKVNIEFLHSCGPRHSLSSGKQTTGREVKNVVKFIFGLPQHPGLSLPDGKPKGGVSMTARHGVDVGTGRVKSDEGLDSVSRGDLEGGKAEPVNSTLVVPSAVSTHASFFSSLRSHSHHKRLSFMHVCLAWHNTAIRLYLRLPDFFDRTRLPSLSRISSPRCVPCM